MRKLLVKFDRSLPGECAFYDKLRIALEKRGIDCICGVDNIEVDVDDYEEAIRVMEWRREKRENSRRLFRRGIKLAECIGRYSKFVVDDLYDKLVDFSFMDVYLSDDMRGGSVIKNWDRDCEWRFEYRNIVGAKELMGIHVIVTKLDKSRVWIMPIDFVDMVDDFVEHNNGLGKSVIFDYCFEDMLTDLSVKNYEGSVWKGFIDDKFIFYTGVWR
jgi:hypothetical protein